MLVEGAMNWNRQSGDAGEKRVEGVEKGVDHITKKEHGRDISLAKRNLNVPYGAAQYIIDTDHSFVVFVDPLQAVNHLRV